MMRLHRAAPAALPLLLAGICLSGKPAAAQGRVEIPSETVVRVKLDGALDSKSAKVGQKVTAALASGDRSGFPIGTRFEGEVSEVQTARTDDPGVLDMKFRRALLPGGGSLPVTAELASLADEDVRRSSDGRLSLRGDKKFDYKWVGYGAAGGAVLAVLLGEDFLKGALLGGLGGAVYAYINRDKDRDRHRDDYRDVSLASGTEFGLRLTDRVAFDPQDTYKYYTAAPTTERVAGTREASSGFGSTAVYVDGRRVEFNGARPMSLNGKLYVPLAPVARAADLKLEEVDSDTFRITTDDGVVEGVLDQRSLSLPSGKKVTLEAAPISVDGEIYVPSEFFNRATDMEVKWNRTGLRLDLEPYRVAK